MAPKQERKGRLEKKAENREMAEWTPDEERETKLAEQAEKEGISKEEAVDKQAAEDRIETIRAQFENANEQQAQEIAELQDKIMEEEEVLEDAKKWQSFWQRLRGGSPAVKQAQLNIQSMKEKIEQIKYEAFAGEATESEENKSELGKKAKEKMASRDRDAGRGMTGTMTR